MAMNKAEKARVEALETELAFRWPQEAEPLPMTRAEIQANTVEVTRKDQSVMRTRKVALGWVHNAYSQRVEPAWSDGNIHGLGHTGCYGSQTMGRIYRTRRDATLAMRWEMCRDFAKKLHQVDLALGMPGGGK